MVRAVAREQIDVRIFFPADGERPSGGRSRNAEEPGQVAVQFFHFRSHFTVTLRLGGRIVPVEQQRTGSVFVDHRKQDAERLGSLFQRGGLRVVQNDVVEGLFGKHLPEEPSLFGLRIGILIQERSAERAVAYADGNARHPAEPPEFLRTAVVIQSAVA